jgi:hypothetical protein
MSDISSAKESAIVTKERLKTVKLNTFFSGRVLIKSRFLGTEDGVYR